MSIAETASYRSHALHSDGDCPGCIELQARVDRLESELKWAREADLVLRLKTAFGLRPKESAILAMLYRAEGRPVVRHRLENATLDPDDETDIDVHTNLLSVHISRLRRRLPQGVISTVRQRGYALTLKGLTAVEWALAPHV